MTALEQIRNFVGSYPSADILRDFQVDFTDQIPANGGIFPSGLVEVSRKTDIFGNVTVTNQYILGDTYTTMKVPVIFQIFDPCELDSGDAYQRHIWQLAVVEQNVPELCNQDLLRIHLYAMDASGNAFYVQTQ